MKSQKISLEEEFMSTGNSELHAYRTISEHFQFFQDAHFSSLIIQEVRITAEFFLLSTSLILRVAKT